MMFIIALLSLSTYAAALNQSFETTPRPKCIVFDLDGTLWNRPRFRKGPPFAPVECGAKGVRAASGEVLDLYPDVRGIFQSFKGDIGSGSDKNSGDEFGAVQVAFISRGHRPEWAKSFLELLSVESSRPLDGLNDDEIESNSLISVMDYCDALVIRDGSKARLHLRDVSRFLNVDRNEMLFFDDRLHEVQDAESIGGVVGVHCPNGLTWKIFHDGIAKFARRRGSKNKQLRGRVKRRGSAGVGRG